MTVTETLMFVLLAFALGLALAAAWQYRARFRDRTTSSDCWEEEAESWRDRYVRDLEYRVNNPPAPPAERPA